MALAASVGFSAAMMSADHLSASLATIQPWRSALSSLAPLGAGMRCALSRSWRRSSWCARVSRGIAASMALVAHLSRCSMMSCDSMVPHCLKRWITTPSTNANTADTASRPSAVSWLKWLSTHFLIKFTTRTRIGPTHACASALDDAPDSGTSPSSVT